METIKKADPRNSSKVWTIKSPIDGYYLANFEVEGQPQKEPAQVVKLDSVASVLGVSADTVKSWFRGLAA